MADKKDWQGRVGQEWANKADGLDQLLGPIGEAGISTLGNIDGKRVLDVGCGAGSTSRALAALGADVTGVDVSPDLLAVAKKQGGPQYILADAATDPLDGPYDAIFSRFGAMFFDDPVAGWTHIRSEARDGANLSIISWCDATENGWACIPLMAARPFLGEEKTQMTPSYAPGPFAWADPIYFGPILMKAGWKDVQWSEVDRLAVLTAGDNPDPIERAVLSSLRIGVLASRLADVPKDVIEDIANALRNAFQNYLDGDAVRVPTKAWIITGKA